MLSGLLLSIALPAMRAETLLAIDIFLYHSICSRFHPSKKMVERRLLVSKNNKAYFAIALNKPDFHQTIAIDFQWWVIAIAACDDLGEKYTGANFDCIYIGGTAENGKGNITFIDNTTLRGGLVQRQCLGGQELQFGFQGLVEAIFTPMVEYVVELQVWLDAEYGGQLAECVRS